MIESISHVVKNPTTTDNQDGEAEGNRSQNVFMVFLLPFGGWGKHDSVGHLAPAVPRRASRGAGQVGQVDPLRPADKRRIGAFPYPRILLARPASCPVIVGLLCPLWPPPTQPPLPRSCDPSSQTTSAFPSPVTSCPVHPTE